MPSNLDMFSREAGWLAYWTWSLATRPKARGEFAHPECHPDYQGEFDVGFDMAARGLPCPEPYRPRS